MSTTPEDRPDLFYLDYEDVLEIHRDVLIPGERPGILHPQVIQSAVERPRRTAFGEDAFPSIWEKAAAFMHALIRWHPFTDGNHRTGQESVSTFLRLNGCPINFNQDLVEAEKFIRAVGRGAYDGDTEIADIGPSSRLSLLLRADQADKRVAATTAVRVGRSR